MPAHSRSRHGRTSDCQQQGGYEAEAPKLNSTLYTHKPISVPTASLSFLACEAPHACSPVAGYSGDEGVSSALWTAHLL